MPHPLHSAAHASPARLALRARPFDAIASAGLALRARPSLAAAPARLA
jgi:hypothetical protein